MSIFGSILSAIGLGSDAQAQTPAAGSTDPGQASSDTAPSDGATEAGPQSASSTPFDVAAMLQNKASSAGQALNYDSSIVDLLKLLDLPSDLATRQQLAHELNYTGSTDNTAEMNTWLHREVMTQLADHGGQVPDDWKHPG